VSDVRGEYNIDLVLADSTIWRGISPEVQETIKTARAQMPPYEPQPVDSRTMARYAGDERLRQEARELFINKQWKDVVARLEALQYPQFMDVADRRRLDLARDHSRFSDSD